MIFIRAVRRFIPLLLLGFGLLWAPAPAPAVTMQTTRFVAEFEGFVSCPYADPAGHATIGYGHLLHYGPPTRADRRKWGCLTKAQALRLLRQDLRKYEAEVLKRLRGARYNAPMIQALTSFAFNLGPGYLDYQPRRGKRPATNISRNVRIGRYGIAARQMLYFDGVISGGKRYVLKGLQIRRRKEYRVMARGIRQLRSCGAACNPVSQRPGSGDGPGGGGSGGMAPGGLRVR